MNGPSGLAKVTSYDLVSGLWSKATTRIAVLSDIHACGRWMPLERIARIVEQTNALRPDMIALPGDFLVGTLVGKRPIAARAIAETLAKLSAPMGVYATLGNHDWADCPEARASGYARSSMARELSLAGLRVLSNESVCLNCGTYVVGLDSAIGHGTTLNPASRLDARRAFAGVPPDASVVLLAHEPDFFLDQDRPVALQLSGHTHGGQIGALGILATYPSRYWTRLDYGHKQMGERHLVISAGVGFGGVPIRAGRTSEITLVSLTSAVAAPQARAAS